MKAYSDVPRTRAEYESDGSRHDALDLCATLERELAAMTNKRDDERAIAMRWRDMHEKALEDRDAWMAKYLSEITHSMVTK